MNAKPSLSRTIARTLLVNLTACGAVAAGALGLAAEANGSQVSVDRPDVAATAEVVAEQLGCWDGAAPVGQVAGSVLLRVDGVGVVRDGRAFDRAIEQEVYGIDHGMDVAAFCPAADGDLEVVR